MINEFESGIYVLEIKVNNSEKFINKLWKEKIEVANVKKIDKATIKMRIYREDYKQVEEIVKLFKGKITILQRKGNSFRIKRYKKRVGLVIGMFLFFGIIYYLSTYIWSIEISTEKNLSPFEIRQQIRNIGICPGISKDKIDVYVLENKIKNMNDEVLWVRARIEGARLTIVIKERLNPPLIEDNPSYKDNVAWMGGEVERIYANSGTVMVQPGDIVKEGDLLIKASQGEGEAEMQVPAKGRVIANTFYEKEMELQISGEEIVRTGEKDEDIYLEVKNKRIYLKKFINSYEYYDKIEEEGNLINKVIYYKKEPKKITSDKEQIIEKGVKELEKSLKINLKNEAIIIDKEISTTEAKNGKINLKVIFVVKQDIANVY